MNHPERIILIAVMAGIVAAGFTWFGWELLQNIFAVRRRRGDTNPPAATPTPQRESGEKPAQPEVDKKGG